MPEPQSILQGLRTIVSEWPILAILWHVFFGAIVVAIVAGWRPERRDLGLYLVLPFVSVGALAWLHFNPFNGTAFGAVGLLLLFASMRLGRERVSFGPAWLILPGVLLFAFGWGYPHFVNTESWWPYLYRAPTGLIPCPTLAIITGTSLVFGAFESRLWAWTLGLAGLFYGLLGALYLGVVMDWVVAGGAALILVAPRASASFAPRQRVEPTFGSGR